MNLLLFRSEELFEQRYLRLQGRRLSHLHQVLRSQQGDCLRVGELGGQLGTATIEAIDDESATLSIVLATPPPLPLDVTLVLALPRPKMLRRILRGATELGVKNIHLIHSYRVEKSYWQSPLLEVPALEEALLAGLEQSRDTVLPLVQTHRRFKPFAEDLLPSLCRGRLSLLADLASTRPYPAQPKTPALLLVGPEGGFIPFELALLQEAGAQSVSLGQRVLRVETALHSALGRHLLV